MQAERELRVAQSDFDRQAEITKLLLEGIGQSQSSHLRYLHSFVESQVRYYNHCVEIMNGLQKDLARWVKTSYVVWHVAIIIPLVNIML